MWLFGENLVCGLLSASGLPESPPLQEMLSLTVIMLLMGQWRVRLEGALRDGTDCLSVTVRRLRAACDLGKALPWHTWEAEPVAFIQFVTPRSPASLARMHVHSSGRGSARRVSVQEPSCSRYGYSRADHGLWCSADLSLLRYMVVPCQASMVITRVP